MAVFLLTKGYGAGVEIEVEDFQRDLKFNLPGCKCVRGWRVLGLPGVLQGPETNFQRSLRERKNLMVCTCIGRLTESEEA